MPPARFLRDYWQKRPLLIRDAFPDFVPPLSPDELAGLACTDGALARIVAHDARRDRWRVATGPFEDAAFAALPKSHWTLLVQDVDKWDAGTAALLDRFTLIPSWRIDDVMISYAVAAGGVGAHTDQYDVFVLQGLGERRWAIDTRPDPPTAFRADSTLKLLREFTPTHAWVLRPGDMLYLPPGVPHDGVALGECMTFSVGLRAPSAGELLVDFAAHVAEAMPESRRFADPDLTPARAAGEIDGAAMRRARDAIGPASAMLDGARFAEWFGCFITRYRLAADPAPRRRPVDRVRLARDLRRLRLERSPWSRMAWCRKGRDAVLFAGGEAHPAPHRWARAVAGSSRVLDGTLLAELPAQPRGIALLAALIDAGHLRILRNRA